MNHNIIYTLILSIGVGGFTLLFSYVFLVSIQQGQIFQNYLNFLASKLLSSDIKRFQNGERGLKGSVLSELQLLDVNTQGLLSGEVKQEETKISTDLQLQKAFEQLNDAFRTALKKVGKSESQEVSEFDSLIAENLKALKLEGLREIASKHKYLYKALGGCGFCFNFWLTTFVFWVSLPLLSFVGPEWFTWWVYLLFTPIISILGFRFITTSWSIFKYLEQ